MLKIAITGNIGAGKSTVCRVFESMGIPVFNSDNAAREIEKLPDVQKRFKEVLGNDIYVNGVLDRVKMRSIVFPDKEMLAKINNIVIPYIREEFNKFYSIKSVETKQPYCMFESAIVIETGNKDHFDKIITVSSDINKRIERVKKRDGITEEEVMSKINAQMSDQQKEDHADYIIKNNGEDLQQQVQRIHDRISKIFITKQKVHYPEINGIYKHYKGGKYQVITMANDSETKLPVVVYKSLLFGSYHVRPLSMWFDIIGVDDGEYSIHRFELIQ